MAGIADYPVTFGYLAKTTINGKPYTHRGLDRSAPTGVPVYIGSDLIGHTGASGLVTGPHLHTQAGRDMYAQQTINPAPYEFKRGTVVAVRTTDSGAWGRYVDVKTESGVYVVYAHLSKVNVNVGQKVGYSSGGQSMTDKEAHDIGVQAYRTIYHREPESSKAAKGMGRRFEVRGKITPDQVKKALASNRGGEWQAIDNKINQYPKLKEDSTNLVDALLSRDKAEQELEKEKAVSDSLRTDNKALENEVADLKADIEVMKAQAGEDSVALNKLGEVARYFLKRWGIN